jgi:hypothetical protein
MTSEMRSPTVSVVIPSYNTPVEWLSQAVHSVLGQTYPDLEIIIVDDGSTEPVARCLGIRDERVRCVRQENKGPAAARNHGIRLALGQHIAFLDADDLFLPTKLERQVAAMRLYPEVLLSHTSYQRIDVEGNYLQDVRSGTFSGMVYPEIIRCCTIATPTVMVRKDILGEKLMFDESLRVGEDVILWMRTAKESAILGIDEPLTKVRIHGNNAAFSSRAQITGLGNLIGYVMKDATDLSLCFRFQVLSRMYAALLYWHLRDLPCVPRIKARR